MLRQMFTPPRLQNPILLDAWERLVCMSLTSAGAKVKAVST